MKSVIELEQGLEMLGALLEERGHSFELVVIGGGALLLSGWIRRPTEDLDVVARVRENSLIYAQPLPEELTRAVRDVASVYALPTEDTHEKDWLNAGPAYLLRSGLPEGFEHRLSTRHYGSLILHLASRLDQIHLKLWAATAMGRSRRKVDVQDLRALQPTKEELRQAIAWCARLDGRADYVDLDIRPVLVDLGFEGGVVDER
jgi:hypothetical protein